MDDTANLRGQHLADFWTAACRSDFGHSSKIDGVQTQRSLGERYRNACDTHGISLKISFLTLLLNTMAFRLQVSVPSLLQSWFDYLDREKNSCHVPLPLKIVISSGEPLTEDTAQ